MSDDCCHLRKKKYRAERCRPRGEVGRAPDRERPRVRLSKGWTIDDAHVYADDAVSGAETKKLVNRSRLLDAIRSGPPFRALILRDASRFSRRDGDEAFSELKAIAKAGVEIWFYQDGTKFTYGTMGRQRHRLRPRDERRVPPPDREVDARRDGAEGGGRPRHRRARLRLRHPAVVERALAYAEQAITHDRSVDQIAALEADLADTETAIRRLTAAIVAGGELGSLVAALETYEQRRRDLDGRLTVIRTPRPTVDAAALRASLAAYLRDWHGLLRGHVRQGQQALRRLIVGRLTFTPTDDGYYSFAGKGTVRPLLAGVVRNLASPAGFETVLQPVYAIEIAA